jgi:hypothetical protein
MVNSHTINANHKVPGRNLRGDIFNCGHFAPKIRGAKKLVPLHLKKPAN